VSVLRRMENAGKAVGAQCGPLACTIWHWIRIAAAILAGYFSGAIRSRYCALRNGMENVKTGAGLSTLSRGGWNVFLHRQLARTLPERFARSARGSTANGGAEGAGKTAIPYRRLGDLARPLALRVDSAARRRRCHQPLAADQARVFESLAHDRTAFPRARRPWGTSPMATPVLGTRDPRRTGLCSTCRLLPHKPAQTWLRQTDSGLASFDVSPLCGPRHLSTGLGGCS
jgi:hypothetical protein